MRPVSYTPNTPDMALWDDLVDRLKVLDVGYLSGGSAWGGLACMVAEGRLHPHITVETAWTEIGDVAQRLLDRATPERPCFTLRHKQPRANP